MSNNGCSINVSVFQFAMTMGLPIMSADWLQRLWNERNNIEISVNSEDVVGCFGIKDSTFFAWLNFFAI